MTDTRSQPGILAALVPHGSSMTFRLVHGADPKVSLARLRDQCDPAHATVGIGEPLARAMDATIPGLRTALALSGPGCSVPSTQQALWISVRGASRGEVIDRAETLSALVTPAFAIVDSVDTFVYGEGRDLSGYVDGTENPVDEAAAAAALTLGDDGIAGSSFAAVQRWVHDLEHFHGHTREQRDAMIGRRHEDNQEIEDAPSSAHVKRAAQESYEPAAFMVRRSMPFVAGNTKGLEFVAYGKSLDAFESVLRRMVGLDDGVVDALFRFTRPVTGGYYWCPPIARGRLDLRALRI